LLCENSFKPSPLFKGGLGGILEYDEIRLNPSTSLLKKRDLKKALAVKFENG
jgi:hypothetical protein